MFRIQRIFLELLGVILLSVYLSNIAYMALKIILSITVIMPLYGLYRSIKGQDNTKGLRYYLLPIFNIPRKFISLNILA